LSEKKGRKGRGFFCVLKVFINPGIEPAGFFSGWEYIANKRTGFMDKILFLNPVFPESLSKGRFGEWILKSHNQ
jgi:hypothetical protein